MAVAIEIEKQSVLGATVVRSDAELRELERDWKELFYRIGCSNPFLSWEWMATHWTHLSTADQKLYVITVRDELGTLTGLAPLQLSHSVKLLRTRRVGFIADELVGTDYLDFLVDECDRKTVLAKISDLLCEQKENWDYLEFRDSLEDSAVATDLAELLRKNQLSCHRSSSSLCPFVPLPDVATTFFSSVGKKLRSNYSYYLRSLKREGPVEFQVVKDKTELLELFEVLVELHRARFVGKSNESAFLQPEVLKFHRAALGQLATAGMARLYVLRLREQPIAILYGMSSGKRLFFYQSGIDPNFGRFSPGMLLVGSVIESAISERLCEFDFLRGDEPYKFQWTSQTRQMGTLRFYRHSPKSLLLCQAHRARVFVRRTLSAVLPNHGTRTS